jgi:hypothetical protein
LIVEEPGSRQTSHPTMMNAATIGTAKVATTFGYTLAPRSAGPFYSFALMHKHHMH